MRDKDKARRRMTLTGNFADTIDHFILPGCPWGHPHIRQRFVVWDETLRGFGVEVHRVTSSKVWKYVYNFRGRTRWITLGRVGVLDAAEARKRAMRLAVAVLDGLDPAQERQAEKRADTFARLMERYVNEHCKRHNRSWRQCEALLRKHALPRWEHRLAKSIARRDVKELLGSIASSSVAAAVHVNLGACFRWAVEEVVVAANPCRGIRRASPRARAHLER